MGIPVLQYSVYMHRNIVNGKVYIGVTKQAPEKRFQNGYGYKYSNLDFWRDIEKYGWDKFEHKILLSGLSKDEASIKEKEFIDKYSSTDKKYGYNKLEGGFRAKRPDASALMRKRVGKLNPNYGKKVNDKTKKALINHARYGQCGTNNHMAKAVVMLDEDFNVICEFSTAKEAVKKLNLKSNHISECCKGKRKTAHGYIWRYKERNDDLSAYRY